MRDVQLTRDATLTATPASKANKLTHRQRMGRQREGEREDTAAIIMRTLQRVMQGNVYGATKLQFGNKFRSCSAAL